MRHSRPTHTAAVVCLFLSSLISVAFAADQAASAQLVKVTKTASDKVAVPATPTLQKIAPAGSALYIAKRGESVISVARHISAQDFIFNFVGSGGSNSSAQRRCTGNFSESRDKM